MSGEDLLPVFDVCPNDSTAPLIERLWFRTDVLQSENASEQLRGTRMSPRRLFEYEFMLSGDDRRRNASKVFAHGAGLWQLPVWTDGVALAAPLSAGAVSIPIDTTFLQFAEGFAVIIDGSASEVVTVSAVAPGALTVDATANAWPAGSMVYPAVVARMDGPWTAQAFTQGDDFGTARFMAAQANPSTAAAPALTYRDLPVFDLCTQANEPAAAFNRVTEGMDDDLGIPALFDLAGIPLPSQSVTVAAENREAIADLRALIYWLDGMRGVLWMPTFLDDLRVTANIGAAATQITVAECGYTANVNMAINRRDIQITTRSGAVFHRRITACSAPGAGVELLTLDESLGVAVAAADIAQVSFLQLVRSDADIFELAWLPGPAVECSMSFRGLNRDV